MANALDLLRNATAKVLIVGYPGSAKTGSICSLLNAGLKVRVLAYDKIGNMAPLLQFTNPDKLANLDIVELEDKYRSGEKFIENAGKPTAFVDGFKLMDNWRYKNADGSWTDLGRSAEWGPDTVVVLDSLTAQGEAAMRRAMYIANRTPLNTTQAVWGHAIKDQSAFLERLLSSETHHHVVVLSHLKMIGPQDVQKDDSSVMKAAKEQMADLIPTRLYPTALGRGLPQTIAGLGFNAVMLAERVVKAGKVSHNLTTKVGPELDVKIAAKNLPDTLPVSDGLLKVFMAVTGGEPQKWLAKSEEQKEVKNV